MISLLEQQCKMAGVNILLNCRAKEINWQRNSVRVLCADGNVINGNKTVITAPIGILQLPKDDEYFLAFNPPLIRKTDAIAGMGYGAAIKVMILFETAFWKNAVWKKQTGNVAEELGFIISDAEIPTWWTQHPLQNNLLTGWLGGPSARKARDWSDADFLNKALQSLADIFQESITQLKEKISAWHIANWSADPYARGAYTYATLHTAAGVSVLENPESDTIFFAGEGIYDGKAKGTVEAALASAETVVSKILGV